MTRNKTFFLILLLTLNALLASCAGLAASDADYRGGSPVEAAQVYQQRAEQGDKTAAFKLGGVYQYDLKNFAKAVTAYKRSYELGYLPAAWFIGALYAKGDDSLKQNNGEAEKWFRQGAEQSDPYSMYDLAGLYARQIIQPADDVQGLMWLEAAAMLAGNSRPQNPAEKYILDDSEQYRKAFQARMNKDEINKAMDMASSRIKERDTKTQQ